MINIDKGIFLLSTSYYFVDILKPNKSNHITTISNHSKILKVITGIGTNSIISISSPHHRCFDQEVLLGPAQGHVCADSPLDPPLHQFAGSWDSLTGDDLSAVITVKAVTLC